jgi:hypothetical protein
VCAICEVNVYVENLVALIQKKKEYGKRPRSTFSHWGDINTGTLFSGWVTGERLKSPRAVRY